MKIDLNNYLVHKEPIQKYWKNPKNHRLGLRHAISTWAANSHCPVIVLSFYLAEDLGYTPELIEIIDCLIDFYDYRKILGQSPDSPYKGYDIP